MQGWCWRLLTRADHCHWGDELWRNLTREVTSMNINYHDFLNLRSILLKPDTLLALSLLIFFLFKYYFFIFILFYWRSLPIPLHVCLFRLLLFSLSFYHCLLFWSPSSYFYSVKYKDCKLFLQVTTTFQQMALLFSLTSRAR